MDPMTQFKTAVADPAGWAGRWKADTGKKVLATVCSYTPVEVIHAADALSFRVFGTAGDFSLADGHLQAYCCALVRGILNDVLAGKLGAIDGAVFPHTCDSMQRLSDIWRLNTTFALHQDVVLPVKLNTDTAKAYMVSVIQQFRTSLAEKLGADISDEKLHQAIQASNAVRKALMQMDTLRGEQPGRLTGSDFNLAVRASMIMAPDPWLAAAKDLLAGLDTKTAPSPGAPARAVVLSGGLCGAGAIYETIENSGGVVVHDDLCTGARYYEGLVDETGDPVAALAERYRTRLVCPAKHAGIFNRGQALVDTAKQKKAHGVIFLIQKFCDPHAFDYPYLKKMLDDNGLASLLLEAEDPFSVGEQAATRIEAFLEMI